MYSKMVREGRGILTADELRSGDRYELHEGHPIYCAPTGADGARRQGTGFSVLDTDPAVTEAGIDPGYSPEPGMLRSPDIAVGNVPDHPGWIDGVPPLAVEYAGHAQDEATLLEKIDDLLDRGTQLIWVVRLVAPVRVEVHRAGRPVEHVPVDGTLTAPGILENPVPVRALIDREAAHEATLRNLLQRQGYGDIEAIRSQGKAEGKVEGKAEDVLRILDRRGISVSEEQRALVAGTTDLTTLERWFDRALVAATADDVF